jgi:prefoldin subunit 5
MNKQRRKDLDKVKEYLEAANQPLADAMTDLEGIRDEEEEALESVQENFPDSERASAMEAAVTALQEAIDALESMTGAYDEVVAAIETAQE